MPSSGKVQRRARVLGVTSGSRPRAASQPRISAAAHRRHRPRQAARGSRASCSSGQRHRRGCRPGGRACPAWRTAAPIAGLERVTRSHSRVPAEQSAPLVAMPVLPLEAPSPTSCAASSSTTGRPVSESSPGDCAPDHSATQRRDSHAGHGCRAYPRHGFTICPVSDTLEIHIVSDSTGDTAARVARAAQSQFAISRPRCIRHARVKSRDQLQKALEAAAGRRATVFYTLVDPGLREAMAELAREHRLVTLDVLGPALNAVSTASGMQAIHEPGRHVAARRTVLPPDRGHRVRRQARRRPRRRRPATTPTSSWSACPDVEDADVDAPGLHGLHGRQHPDRPRGSTRPLRSSASSRGRSSA